MTTYEKIGSWVVNRIIPREVREVFREDTEAWLQGEVTEHMVFHSLLFSEIGLLRKHFLHNLPFSRQLEYAKGAIKAFYKELAERKGEESLCYVDYILLGGTTATPPDPFVAEYSYYTGKPVDAYERVQLKAQHMAQEAAEAKQEYQDDEEGHRIVFWPAYMWDSGILTRTQYLIFAPCDPWRQNEHEVALYEKLSPLSEVQVFINPANREARMEPSN